jgi:type II secretory pathway component PulM
MDLQNIIERIKSLIAFGREKIQTVSSTQRDRRAILLLGVVVCVLILYFVIHFFSSGTERLEKRARVLESELRKVQALSAEFEQSKKTMSELARKITKEDEDLISLLEKILLAENLQRQNFSIRDVNTRGSDDEELFEEKSVDVELKRISLDDLVDILYKIQTKQSFLKVSNLSITSKLKQADSVNVKLRVSTFEFKQVI